MPGPMQYGANNNAGNEATGLESSANSVDTFTVTNRAFGTAIAAAALSIGVSARANDYGVIGIGDRVGVYGNGSSRGVRSSRVFIDAAHATNS